MHLSGRVCRVADIGDADFVFRIADSGSYRAEFEKKESVHPFCSGVRQQPKLTKTWGYTEACERTQGPRDRLDAGLNIRVYNRS